MKIDPKQVTQYDRSQAELEAFWLFCILVAGKNSDTTSRVLERLLSNRIFPNMSPFEYIRSLGSTGLYNLLVANRVGQYHRIHEAIWSSLDLDLYTCTKDDLMEIHGVGPKTARFFLLHTREFCDEIVLDTHILRWMREKCGVENAPANTPQNEKQYEELASLCKRLMNAHYPNMSLAQIDLLIWATMSGRLD